MKNVLTTSIMLVMLALAFTAGGCAASGGGGYQGSDGHFGHSH